MKFNPTLVGFIKKEFKQALRDKRMRIVLFVVPIIQLILFGVALNNDTKNVRLSVVGGTLSGDILLNDIYRNALASGWFIPAKVTKTDPFEQIQADEADAVIVAPRDGVTRTVARGDGEIQLLINATNVLRAQSIEQYVQAISTQASQNWLTRNKQPVVAPPIQLEFRILYNPTMRSAVFMVPGVMGMIICMTTILLTSMSISREKEMGTFETLIAAPVTRSEVILGKTLPYVVLGMANLPLIVGVALFAFQVPMRGSLFLLIFSTFVFVCVTVAIGTLISTLAKTQQQSMMGGFLFIFPALQLSGVIFPVENMPGYMRILAYINPLTYYLQIVRNVMLKGADTWLILSHSLILALMAAVVIVISYRRFKTTLS